MQKFTNNDLLLYIFNETTPDLSRTISQSLNTHQALRDEATQLNLIMDDISQFSLEPNPKSIQYIMDALHLEDSIQIL
ncbi:MAG: hypothetical protein KA198_10240 [Chitinophagaceae bacterium]|nr:hypothetical protein [Chitinophagaceae bacterium]